MARRVADPASSAMACTPNSLSQEAGLGFRAQAGEEHLREVAREAGFSNRRCAARTPVNPILELTL
jgi:hypothetical protein